MGTIKTTNIEPIANNGTVTLGSSGDTFTLGSGVKQSNLMNPAFEAYRNASANLTNLAYTKIECDTETFDTDNCYDNTTNYRFTPTVSGKYFVYGHASVNALSSSRLERNWGAIYKNGVVVLQAQNDYRANPLRITASQVSGIVDMNGTTDYLELYVYANATTGTPQYLGLVGTGKRTAFGSYRIGS